MINILLTNVFCRSRSPAFALLEPTVALSSSISLSNFRYLARFSFHKPPARALLFPYTKAATELKRNFGVSFRHLASTLYLRTCIALTFGMYTYLDIPCIELYVVGII